MPKPKTEVSLRVRAMRYLARREHSRAELRSKLLPHVQVIRREIERLESSAENLARQHHAYLAALRSLVERQKAELDALADALPAPFGKVAGAIQPAPEAAEAERPREARKASPKWIRNIVEE